MIHFVGFRGDEYHRAIKVFGLPDFIHKDNDIRLRYGGERHMDDVVIYANSSEGNPKDFAFNDSAFW